MLFDTHRRHFSVARKLHMKDGIHANLCSQDMTHVGMVLSSPLVELSKWLEGEYGGVIEHLWIDLELFQAPRQG